MVFYYTFRNFAAALEQQFTDNVKYVAVRCTNVLAVTVCKRAIDGLA